MGEGHGLSIRGFICYFDYKIFMFSNWLHNYALDLCTLGVIVIYVLDQGTIFMFKHDITTLGLSV